MGLGVAMSSGVGLGSSETAEMGGTFSLPFFLCGSDRFWDWMQVVGEKSCLFAHY